MPYFSVKYCSCLVRKLNLDNKYAISEKNTIKNEFIRIPKPNINIVIPSCVGVRVYLYGPLIKESLFKTSFKFLPVFCAQKINNGDKTKKN